MPKDLLTAAWKLLLLRGVIGIVLGIILVAWPEATIVVLMVLVGIWALIDGIGLAAQVFDKGAGAGQRVLFGVMALIALVVAMVAIFRPGLAASAITWLVGIWLLVRGLFELVGAFSSTVATPRWLLVLGALLDLVLGWLFVTHPGQLGQGRSRSSSASSRSRGAWCSSCWPWRPAAPPRTCPTTSAACRR